MTNVSVAFSTSARKHITNCLRVIRNAWHFYYALNLVVKVVCGGFGIALLTP
ncbi:DUF3265 domain-containing protein [Vibrio alginolyticus]|uniref:DUF3265 domain-containing protein n=1 Tax=Vibrio alginolyticus TaxID=663 RepID=A0A7Y0R1W6_VIBAL|nr:DUF3265 domain-containing protein [Vibrio alginolyticus]NMR76554.1 DUF3265 domain-containing protein [Vibrio alginolyticus]NOH90840.1 DUF3265 domain-containing protein [Vibrio alginolyticus]